MSKCRTYETANPFHRYATNTWSPRVWRGLWWFWCEDADQACRLLLSGLALALLDTCEVEELKPGIYAYLATCRRKSGKTCLGMLVDFNWLQKHQLDMISRNKLSIPHICVINSVNVHWSSTHFSWFLRHDSRLLACWWDLWWPVHEQRPMMERKRLRDRSSCHKAWRSLQLTTFATCPRWIHMVLLSFELLAVSLA